MSEPLTNSEYWHAFWNEHARSDKFYGRDTWSLPAFFLLVDDVQKNLHFGPEDVVLDAGGGAGSLSIAIAPFVKRITLFDYGAEIVARAKEETAAFRNIRVVLDDVRTMRKVRSGYDKVVVGSVLQYLDTYEDVEAVLKSLYRVSRPGARIQLTHNPDLARKPSHLRSYARLDWPRERLERALAVEEKRFWIDKGRFLTRARALGFREAYESPIHKKLWQSTHMVDFVLAR